MLTDWVHRDVHKRADFGQGAALELINAIFLSSWPIDEYTS